MKTRLKLAYVLLFIGIALFPLTASAKVTLTFWGWTDFINVAEAIVPEFETKYPNIGIELVNLGSGDLHDKLLASLFTGVGAPDSAVVVQRRAAQFVDTNLLLDVSSVMEDKREDFPPALLEIVETDSGIYGIPIDFAQSVLFYRRDLFEDKGVEIPIATWDDFIEIAKELTDKESGQYGTWLFYPSGGWGANYFLQFLQSRGGNIFDENGRVIKENQLAKETMRWYYELSEKHGITFNAEYNSPEFLTRLRQGGVATLIVPAWGLTALKTHAVEFDGRWGVMPWPRWSKDAQATTGVWGGSVIVVPGSTKHPEEAKLWAEFFAASVEGTPHNWTVASNPPAYRPARESSVIGLPDAYLGGDNLYDVMMQRTVPEFRYIEHGEVEVIVGSAIEYMFTGRMTPEQAWEWAETTISSNLGL